MAYNENDARELALNTPAKTNGEITPGVIKIANDYYKTYIEVPFTDVVIGNITYPTVKYIVAFDIANDQASPIEKVELEDANGNIKYESAQLHERACGRYTGCTPAVWLPIAIAVYQAKNTM